jgi:hypothetical protein
MSILIKSISPISNYKFDGTYVLAFINNNRIQYTKLDNINNIDEDTIGYIVNRYVKLDTIALVNFYKYNAQSRKLTLMFSSIKNLDISKNTDIVLNGINIELNVKRFNMLDLLKEPFILNLKNDNNKIIIDLSTTCVENKNMNVFNYSVTELLNPFYHKPLNLYADLVQNYVHKKLSKLEYKEANQLVSPINGIIRISDNKLVGINKGTSINMPYDGFLKKIIRDKEKTVFVFTNPYHVSVTKCGKWKWNYNMDNTLNIDREVPYYLKNNNEKELGFKIMLEGDLIIKNGNLKKIFNTLTQGSYKIKPILFKQGALLCESRSSINICINKPIESIESSFYSANDIITKI